MLIYDHEGLLEVEVQAIKQLCRSKDSVIVGDPEHETFEIHSALCNYLDNATQRCLIAFHAKAFKGTLVYTVTGSDAKAMWQNGQEILAQLGFQLEDVNLKLSPAMQEVVLRDLPGLATPGEARKQRQDRARLLVDLQATYDKAPDSAAGRKAANRLRGEKRQDERVLELRQFLEELLEPAEAAAADLRALRDQVHELAERVAAAEALAEAERCQREICESITSAAEKRIQELEASLVEMETLSAKALKQKRKNTQLQKQVKALSDALESAQQEAATALEERQQLMSDSNAAHERIAGLEAELQEAGRSLETAQAQLAEEQAEKARLDEVLRAAELRIEVLDKELAESRDQAGREDEVVEATEDVRTQLEEARQALHETLGRNEELEGELATAVEQGEALARDLRQTEASARDGSGLADQVADLTERNLQLTSELTKVRDEYDQECQLRRHLEESAAQNEKRIKALKKSLARAVEDAEERIAEAVSPSENAAEIEALAAELHRQAELLDLEKQAQEKLETALHQAGEQIDALEEALRQTEQPAARKASLEATPASGKPELQALQEQLQSAEEQLERERAEQGRLARALAEAEQQLAERKPAESPPQAESRGRPSAEPFAEAEPAAEPRQKAASRPLPHELRPAPKKGALFHPDWDLPGLPCTSAKQVYQAWESAFNVQISLEGYPSQYCMVYLVALDLAGQKKLYLLYRLKKTKHTLVSVPASIPCDETSLQKTIAEGLNFLKKSGFEMEEIAAKNIASTLKSYFQEA